MRLLVETAHETGPVATLGARSIAVLERWMIPIFTPRIGPHRTRSQRRIILSGLKDALGKLNDAVKDLTSLHVQTYQGRVEVDLDEVAENGFDSVRAAVTAAAADPEGELKLVAEAYYQFDGDSYNFLTSDDITPEALEIHKAAVEAGIKTRQGLVELFKGLFD